MILTQLASSALYPVTRPSNTFRKTSHHSKYAYHYVHLLNLLVKTQTTNIILSGILYFLVMVLLYAGVAVVSFVGFVFPLRVSMLVQFEWLKFLTCVSQYFPHIPSPGLICCPHNPKHHGMCNPANSPGICTYISTFLGMSIVLCFSHRWPKPKPNFVFSSA